MKFHELAEECWHDMPRLRRVVAGRSTVTRLLADAVREFDPEKVGRNHYHDELLASVQSRTGTDRDGFAIMTFLLVTIAAAVISWLIQRWLDNHFPKEELQAWQRELAS